MLYDPAAKAKATDKKEVDGKVFKRLKSIKEHLFLKKKNKDE